MIRDSISTPFLADLEQRALLVQKTAEFVEPDFNSHPVLYVGYDPSANSLHAGNLIPVLTMDRFRRRGGQIIVLLGGATGLIGDPSGKDQERTLESERVIGERVGSLQLQLAGLFSRTDGPEPIFVNNSDWYREMGVIPFLRDVGKSFSVNQMLMRDSVRSRLEARNQGISFTEFAYQLLQAFDFLYLNGKYGCTIQMGASDQWGNIVSGVDLVRRKTGATVHGITLPLLTNAEGKKYGKTEKGAIWLSSEYTSAYEFYQFWYNASDLDAERFLRWLTDDSPARIAELQSYPPSSRAVQRELAGRLTERVHGSDQANLVRRASEVIFSAQYNELNSDLLEILAKAVPTHFVQRGERCPTWCALVESNTAKSKSEVRRLIEQCSVTANGCTVVDADEDLGRHSTDVGAVIIAVGKTRRLLVLFGTNSGAANAANVKSWDHQRIV